VIVFLAEVTPEIALAVRVGRHGYQVAAILMSWKTMPATRHMSCWRPRGWSFVIQDDGRLRVSAREPMVR